MGNFGTDRSSVVYEGLRTVEGLRKGRSEAPETEPVRPVAEADVQAVLPHLPQVVCDIGAIPASDRVSTE